MHRRADGRWHRSRRHEDIPQGAAYRPRGPAGGNAYALKGQLDSAIADFKKSMALKPGYAGPYDNGGWAYRRNGLGIPL